MSLTVYLNLGGIEVFQASVTHNLTTMADAALVYIAIWRPNEKGLTHAKQLVSSLNSGLVTLLGSPDTYKDLNPENGWGDYEALVKFIKDYMFACMEFPEAVIEVCR